jgi:hypothetical protein
VDSLSAPSAFMHAAEPRNFTDACESSIHPLDRPRAGGIVQGIYVKGAPAGTIRKVRSSNGSNLKIGR